MIKRACVCELLETLVWTGLGVGIFVDVTQRIAEIE